MHNDIQINNLFLRGAEVFIAGKMMIPIIINSIKIHPFDCLQTTKNFVFGSDFDLATLNGEQNHVSANDRYPMDDTHDLVLAMWCLAGLRRDRFPLYDSPEYDDFDPYDDQSPVSKALVGFRPVKCEMKQKLLIFEYLPSLFTTDKM